jgi:hypothetical protein
VLAHSPTHRGSAPRGLIAAALACACLAPAPAALADLPRDQEERGVYIGISGIEERPSNLDFRLASRAGAGEGVRLEYDRSLEAMYELGWLLPQRKGKVGIRYWEMAERQATEQQLTTASFEPIIFLDAVANRGGVNAGAFVLARAVDFDFSRDFNASDRFRATWSLGLRYFRYEHELKAEYRSATGVLNDQAREQVDSSGVGPRVGAAFQYNFNSRWSLSGSASIATLIGTTDHSNVSVTDVGAPFSITSFNEELGEKRIFDQFDFDLKVLFMAWRQLEVGGGYRLSHWMDARSRSPFDGPKEIERVTFDGPYLSLGYRF